MVISLMFLLPSNQRPPESTRVQIIKGENGWTLQDDIINDTGSEKKYTIVVSVDTAVRRDIAVVQAGKTYTYIYHISPQQLTEGQVTFALFEEGKEEPVEQTTYYIGDE